MFSSAWRRFILPTCLLNRFDVSLGLLQNESVGHHSVYDLLEMRETHELLIWWEAKDKVPLCTGRLDVNSAVWQALFICSI